MAMGEVLVVLPLVAVAVGEAVNAHPVAFSSRVLADVVALIYTLKRKDPRGSVFEAHGAPRLTHLLHPGKTLNPKPFEP